MFPFRACQQKLSGCSQLSRQGSEEGKSNSWGSLGPSCAVSLLQSGGQEPTPGNKHGRHGLCVPQGNSSVLVFLPKAWGRLPPTAPLHPPVFQPKILRDFVALSPDGALSTEMGLLPPASPVAAAAAADTWALIPGAPRGEQLQTLRGREVPVNTPL